MGFCEMVKEMEIEIQNDEQTKYDPFAPLDELNTNASMSSINTPSIQIAKNGKKRARNRYPFIDILNELVNKFGNMQTAASDNIRRLVDYFQFEADGAAKRMKVFKEFKKINGLINDQ
ncbi:hypothetical protein PanWU01x14_317690 [Parasponia andersonii]|uniref:Uncharacterized protein n=1 Tax=Parasponia andersonii TaxID=3476 RepID=A0A2P5AMH4_PARAD|nr:hypothetical protein PanWU01x14_317690 [Parasponia andersonii]